MISIMIFVNGKVQIFRRDPNSRCFSIIEQYGELCDFKPCTLNKKTNLTEVVYFYTVLLVFKLFFSGCPINTSLIHRNHLIIQLHTMESFSGPFLNLCQTEGIFFLQPYLFVMHNQSCTSKIFQSKHPLQIPAHDLASSISSLVLLSNPIHQ